SERSNAVPATKGAPCPPVTGPSMVGLGTTADATAGATHEATSAAIQTRYRDIEPPSWAPSALLMFGAYHIRSFAVQGCGAATLTLERGGQYNRPRCRPRTGTRSARASARSSAAICAARWFRPT